MKRQDITFEDKYNELILDITHPNNQGKVFIFVEGESDIRFYRKFFDLQRCKVESIPGGNPKVERSVEMLSKKHALTIGIRDADFIRLGSEPYLKQNMFLTDFHDIEMTLIAADSVFSAMASEHTRSEKEQHLEIRANIIKMIEKISYLKWLNASQNLELTFKRPFHDLLSFPDSNLDFETYFSHVLADSPNAGIRDARQVHEEINQLKNALPDPMHLCNGHDFMKAFAAFLHAHGTTGISEATLSSAFRVAFTMALWQQTLLYASTKDWADRNSCSIY